MEIGLNHLRVIRRRILITAVILFEAAFILFVGEIALRCWGYGYSTDPFVAKQYLGERWHLLNDRYYSQFINTANCPQSYDLPNPIILSEKKPPQSYRIFLFGGSAAYGWFFPDYNMGNILETLLRSACKDYRFEVITVAFHAMNSFTMRYLSDACAQLQPDLFLVYMGNNEMIGPYGLQSVLGSKCQSAAIMRAVVQANLWLSNLKIFQLCGVPAREVFSRSVQNLRWGEYSGVVEKNDPRLERVYNVFQHNLEHICETAHKVGARTVLCTVGYNLRDWRPTISAHRVSLTEKETNEWDHLYQQGKLLEAKKEYEKAIKLYEQALQIDDTHADLLYRLASCYLAQKDNALARRFFLNAVDHSLSFCSANTRINDIITETAARLRNDDVVLAEAFQALADNNADGIPGSDYFYDHVHLRFEGNYIIALEAFSRIMNILRANSSMAELPVPTPLSLEECMQRMGYSEGVHLKEIQEVQHILVGNPTNPVFPLLQTIETQLMQRLEEENEESIAEGYRQALLLDPDNSRIRWRLVEYLTTHGRGKETWNDIKALLAESPCNWHYNWAWISSIAERDPKAAYRYTEEWVALYEEYPETLFCAGNLAMQANKPEQAIEYFQKAISLNNRRGYYYVLLGRAYVQKNNYSRAISAFHSAIQLDMSQSAVILDDIMRMESQMDNSSSRMKEHNELNLLKQMISVSKE